MSQLVLGQRSIATRFAAGETSGFDYMRLSLSVLVMLWHTFAVVWGERGVTPEWYQLFMRMVLPLFFALSGFLVAFSLERIQHLPTFGLLRALRILPALGVEILLSALILGPILTTVALSTYFTHPEFFRYFLNTIGWIHYDLPGVFRDNPVSWVNRSLWTVPFELECYALLAGLYLLGMYRRTWMLVVALVAFSAFCLWHYRDYSYADAPLVPGRLLIAYFLAGNIICKLRDRLPGGLLAASCALVLGWLMLTNVAATIMLSPLVVAYASAAIGCLAPRKLPIIFTGDYSYGLYLYAFPVQQTVYSLMRSDSILENFLVSLAATSLFAAFSWHFIEKPILGLKKQLIPKSWSRSESKTAATAPSGPGSAEKAAPNQAGAN